MSFSADIKQEIANKDLEKHCQRAQLSALIQLTSSLKLGKGAFTMRVRSENPTTAKRIIFLLKQLYKVETNLQVARKTNLKKNNVYYIDVDQDVIPILEDLGIYTSRGIESHPRYEVVMKNCCAASYLAGAFLAYGSCNEPANAGYHLELSLNDLEQANYAVKLISRFSIEARTVIRRKRYVVYIKKADYISAFLALIGAHDAMMRFEDERISRDLMNSLSRINNCEIANEMKTFRAAQDQVEALQRIMDSNKYQTLDEKLRNVIDLRMRFQDSSLLELCEEYQRNYGDLISKSGMKHRLDKLMSIAEDLK